ncbi:DUF6090 family protein [Eudoraea sp.]|uniref:DUF6090 family protein n=1 Tax=Eudoraea sp. TaxID=1979955 RepID=UPI003C75E2AD
MLQFFRQIRQRLLTNNKFSKYLLYAVGEIVLVVIGILIALSINNWNEDRINSRREKVILNSLKSELIINLNELNTDYERTLKFHQATINVYDFILMKPTEIDSLYKDFFNCVQFTYFFPKTSTYESLKSGNLELIKSDSLKEIITDVYETGFKRIVNKVDTRRNAARLLFPYYQKHFTTKFLKDVDYSDFRENKFKIGVPNNYTALVNDPEFETLVVEAISGRANFLRDFERTIGNVELCLSQINRYLDN